MKAIDWIEGLGVALPSVLHNENGHIAANVVWRVGTGKTTEIKIVGKASHPEGVESIPDQLHDGATVRLTFDAGYIPERYWRAVVRAAYLAAFEQFGYGYALTDSAALVRRVVDGTDSMPDVILRAHPQPDLPKQVWVLPIRGEQSCLVVMLRMRSEATRYLAVLLPGRGWSQLVEIAAQWRQLRVRGTCEESDIAVTFGPDPVKMMRETRFPAEGGE